MPKQQNKILSMAQLRASKARAKSKPLTFKVTVPGPAVPLFQALAVLQGCTVEEMGREAILDWLASEEAAEIVDDQVNSHLTRLRGPSRN